MSHGSKPVSRAKAERIVSAMQEMADAGFRTEPDSKRRTLQGQAAKFTGVTPTGIRHSLRSIEQNYPDLWEEIERLVALPPVEPAEPERPHFVIAPNVGKDAPIEELLDAIEKRHAKTEAADRQIIPVNISVEGPIAIAIIGDIHIDDPGCAMGPLRRDTQIVAETEGMFAVAVGDYRNNWVGRLTKLWAEQPVTQSQALRLIEWWFGECGAKLIAGVEGNHDAWHNEGGDAVKIMHRLSGFSGLYGEPAYRLSLRLPGGAEARMHVRHDFPWRSQFNAAHGPVRETLFGYRDHIIACGDRHHSGYMPMWHNDPARMCHAIRVGCYKDFDKYATEKGFRWENWARSMVAIIDPRFADDPVEFVSVRFSVAAGAEELKRRRQAWRADLQKTQFNPGRAKKPIKRGR